MNPITMGIGGGGSSSGKTSVACLILKDLSSKGMRLGAIKYTKTAFYASVVQDPVILAQRGKDTARYLQAGAEEALWVQSPRKDLPECLSTALTMLSHLDAVLIEGNSAIEVLRPDIVIFITGRFKPGSERVLEMADIVVSDSFVRGARHASHSNVSGLLKQVADLIMNTEIKKALKEKAKEGRITCSEAQEIARRLGVLPKEIGKTANALGIKITDCQMGCF